MILKLEHIYKDYIQGKLTVPVLKDVSLHVEEGEYVAIMGPNRLHWMTTRVVLKSFESIW